MTNDLFELTQLRDPVAARGESVWPAWLAPLGASGDQSASSSVTITADGSRQDEQSQLPVSIEAHRRYPLLSNFRSRSRHRRGMPAPMPAS